MNHFSTGLRSLGSGFGIILRSPRLLLLGAVPALVSAVLLLVALGALISVSGDLVTWMTPFADGWAALWRSVVRIVLGVALVVGAGVLGSLSFIALTLLIGGPFYERIAETAEARLGLDPATDGAGWWRLLRRGITDAIKLVLVAVAGGLVLFVGGFVPIVGQIVVPVLAVLFGAWVISLEMTGMVFQRRGAGLRERHRVLRRHRRAVLGFGVPTYLLCLVPVAQLVVIPSAVVGGTLLSHRMLESERSAGSASAGTADPPTALGSRA